MKRTICRYHDITHTVSKTLSNEKMTSLAPFPKPFPMERNRYYDITPTLSKTLSNGKKQIR